MFLLDTTGGILFKAFYHGREFLCHGRRFLSIDLYEACTSGGTENLRAIREPVYVPLSSRSSLLKFST